MEREACVTCTEGKTNVTRCQLEKLRESFLRDISIDGRLNLKFTLIRVLGCRKRCTGYGCIRGVS